MIASSEIFDGIGNNVSVKEYAEKEVQKAKAETRLESALAMLAAGIPLAGSQYFTSAHRADRSGTGIILGMGVWVVYNFCAVYRCTCLDFLWVDFILRALVVVNFGVYNRHYVKLPISLPLSLFSPLIRHHACLFFAIVCFVVSPFR